MPLPSSEAVVVRNASHRLIAGLAGVTLGLFSALSAHAFAPLSGPVLASTGVPPNVVMLFDNSSSMVLYEIDGKTRLDIARDAAKDVIAANRNVRFGLFVFRDTVGSRWNRDAPGGRLERTVGSISSESVEDRQRFDELNAALDALEPSSNPANYTYTPLAESYYEITRYMRGLRAFYPQGTLTSSRMRFTSPIEYRCQKNSGLILTDGMPTYDNQFPSSSAAEPDGDNSGVVGNFNLPDWDGIATGDVSDPTLSEEGSTFYLDDIARFAYDIDLRSSGGEGADTDGAGQSWDDPAFPVQNMRTYTVGFSVDDPRLESVANAGNGNYYTARDSAELTDALNTALQEINAASGSGGGGVSSQDQLQDGTLFYRTRYDPQDWSGTVEALYVTSEGRVGAPAWSTDTTITPARRTSVYQTWRQPDGAAPGSVVSLDGSTFNSALGAEQQAALNLSAAVAGLTGPERGQQLLDWSRGVSIKGLRSRTRLLGDIVNSPLLLANPQAVLATGGSGYSDYRQAKRSQMIASLVAGSNDGFLHVIAARDGQGAVSGEHRLAYLPAALHGRMGRKARPDYGTSHQSGVDGPITLADAQLNGVWSTVAVAGLGAGGKGLLAVRLFNATDGNAALGGLWEVRPADHGWEDLGYSYARPAIGELNGKWVAIVGNGYGSSKGQAVLYVLDLATGALIRSISAGEAGDNGLSSPQVILDSEGAIVGAYAGDIQGRMWKFDLAGDASDWALGLDGDPLFSAEQNQPITVQPQLIGHPQGGRLVLFGTGKFLEAKDLSDKSEQAFYAVWDKPGGHALLTAEDLLEQSITDQISTNGTAYRMVSQTRIDWTRHAGWTLPLIYDDNAQGERLFRQFAIRGSRVIFNTGLITERGNDPCVTEGDGWLMVLNIYSGGMLPAAALDTNGDRIIDGGDQPGAGVDLDVGLPGDLNIVRRNEPPPECEDEEQCRCDPEDDDCVEEDPCGEEYYLTPGSDGVASIVGISRCVFNRVMWRQLM
ncbi:MAG TPA: pilus assembly protein [Pseudomonas xinjiangensis]|uniref:Pilus assembly protein n=2 Tax=root TaxID=1 RepID=A0A7V1FRS5_9GAMM|nr:pilus assembly protein [Halopseudomonas xinjiangensis]HEC49226.1 pilus assembly protein [Halopseudomonas xinjiangensis]